MGDSCSAPITVSLTLKGICAISETEEILKLSFIQESREANFNLSECRFSCRTEYWEQMLPWSAQIFFLEETLCSCEIVTRGLIRLSFL